MIAKAQKVSAWGSKRGQQNAWIVSHLCNALARYMAHIRLEPCRYGINLDGTFRLSKTWGAAHVPMHRIRIQFNTWRIAVHDVHAQVSKHTCMPQVSKHTCMRTIKQRLTALSFAVAGLRFAPGIGLQVQSVYRHAGPCCSSVLRTANRCMAMLQGQALLMPGSVCASLAMTE